jgi:hypothetical protein
VGKEEMMNRSIRALLCLAWLLVVVSGRANPILDGFINELLFNNGKWVMEIHSIAPSLDGWVLGSRHGDAAFKPGIMLNGNYVLVTEDSMLSPLAIDSLGDSLSMHSPPGFVITLTYGNLPHHVVQAPAAGQSICLQEEESFYYLDTTPTPGYRNDSDGAMACVEGLVRDSLTQLPLGNTGVWLQRFPPEHTDSVGHFRFNVYARVLDVVFSHTGYSPKTAHLDMLPGNTYEISIDMPPTGQGVAPSVLPGSISVSQNYPNPFNPSTTISYSLSRPSRVKIVVYDLLGHAVAELVDALQTPGEQRVRWDGADDAGAPHASGLYLVRVTLEETGGCTAEERTIKALLLR